MTLMEKLQNRMVFDAADEGGDGAEGDGGQPEPEQHKTAGEGDAQSVLDMLSDDTLKESENLAKFKSVDDLAYSYEHLSKMQGKDKLPLPTDESDTETMEEVYRRLGKPEDPTEYELPSIAEDSQFEPSEEFLESFKSKAHELGLNNKQVKDLFGWYVQDVAEQEISQMQQQAQEYREHAEQTLRKEFGNAYDEKVDLANQAVWEFGGEELATRLQETGMGNDPTFVKLFAQLGEQLQEDQVGGSSKKDFGRTPEQAQAEIAELKQSPSFMDVYMDGSKPGHKEAVQKMHSLYQDAFPD